MSSISIVGHSDIGRLRQENQDAIGWHVEPSTPFGYFILADGMGGHAGGAKAAEFVVSYICDSFSLLLESEFRYMEYEQQLECLRQKCFNTVVESNHALLEYKKNCSPEWSEMGTTVVVGLIWGNFVLIAHVGDSRAYLWQGGALQQLTKDHSMVQELIDAGQLNEQQAKESGISNVVTQALGTSNSVNPDMCQFMLEPGAVILACSDGLTEYHTAQDLANEFAQNLPLMQSCYRLIEASNERGGKDNISVILTQSV